jgi:hypothetical protein
VEKTTFSSSMLRGAFLKMHNFKSFIVFSRNRYCGCHLPMLPSSNHEITGKPPKTKSNTRSLFVFFVLFLCVSHHTAVGLLLTAATCCFLPRPSLRTSGKHLTLSHKHKPKGMRNHKQCWFFFFS